MTSLILSYPGVILVGVKINSDENLIHSMETILGVFTAASINTMYCNIKIISAQ